MTRPPKQIDWKRVDKLLMAGCKGTEIAPHFDMHHDTFYRKVEEHYNLSFTAYSQLKKEEGDSLLREAQFDKALEKDNTMMIWLGKQRLDQREPEAKHNIQASEEAKDIIVQIKDGNRDSKHITESSEVSVGSDSSS